MTRLYSGIHDICQEIIALLFPQNIATDRCYDFKQIYFIKLLKKLSQCSCCCCPFLLCSSELYAFKQHWFTCFKGFLWQSLDELPNKPQTLSMTSHIDLKTGLAACSTRTALYMLRMQINCFFLNLLSAYLVNVGNAECCLFSKEY